MSKIHTIFLITFSLLLFLPGISTLPVIDRDEAHFAQATKQMLQTGNFFQIRFQDITRFQKPPGINWLQAGAVKLFSNSNFSRIWPYRLPSVLGALFAVIFTYSFACRFIPSQTAAIAAGLLASSLLLIVEAHMAVIDAALLASVLLMQGALWVIYQEKIEEKTPHWRWVICFWLSLCLGIILKGVTPLIAFLSITTLCFWEKKIDWLADLKIFYGLLFILLVNLGWLLAVNEAEKSNYLLQMINRDLLPKLQGGHESHGQPPLFHLFILPVTFWPASLFLWFGVQYAWKNRHTRLVKFLLAWLIPSWIFFECMPTKLPQYVLPLFPPIALLCALGLQANFKMRPTFSLRLLQSLWGILSLSMGCILLLLVYVILQHLTAASLAGSFIMTLFTAVVLYYGYQGNNYKGLWAIFLMTPLTFFLIFKTILPSLKPLWLSDTIAKTLPLTKLSVKNPLLTIGFEEPSLVFNTDTNLINFTDWNALVNQFKEMPQRFALVEAQSLQQWPNRPQTLITLAELKGFNYNKGKWVKLILIGPKS